EKVDVSGTNQHPLYSWLCNQQKNGKFNSSVKWNFQKYFVDKNGELVNYFYSITKPNSNKIVSLIK
ncbi:MAG: glutathione peroxidase, partial [Flavobacteriales bacterium]|nr:glutathione peroxidase [Flavobacteriales bacterium]